MKTLTTQQFINRSQCIHHNKYDYANIKYVNGATKVVIICSKHGAFSQTPYKHLEGRGCPLCTHNNTTNNKEIFIATALQIHSEKYIYSSVDYKNARTKVQIICHTHGEFWQTPDNHLHGHGCSACMADIQSISKLSSTEIFTQSAKIIHGSLYEYSLVNYQNAKTKVKIICSNHGIFHQTPSDHLGGHGCPKCVKVVSLLETLWLDILKIPNDQNHRQVRLTVGDRSFKVDGFSPTTKTVYEFYGDFWHGNPNKFKPTEINLLNKQSFGDLYAATMTKEKILKNAGYTVISIWENDFKSNLKLAG
jgi:hypothetical protein